jgi:putative acetyltransferase
VSFALRPEGPSDAAAIRRVHERAFARNEEADLVEALRRHGCIAISLLAQEDSDVIAHVLLSRMEAPFRALGLGPVAVIPEQQRRNVGTALIREALRQAAEQGWEAAFVVGEPQYYRRFGFDAAKAAGFTSPYSGPYLMALALQTAELPVTTGKVNYPPPFAEFE